MGGGGGMEQYEEIRKLGAGSFGVAMLVRRRGDGALVVAKKMRVVGMSTKERDDALNEARCLSKIRHAYVTRYHESLFEKGFLCIIMEACLVFTCVVIESLFSASCIIYITYTYIHTHMYVIYSIIYVNLSYTRHI